MEVLDWTPLHATWEPNTKTYGLLLHWCVESTVLPPHCRCLAKLAPTRVHSPCVNIPTLSVTRADSDLKIPRDSYATMLFVGPSLDDPCLFILLITTKRAETETQSLYLYEAHPLYRTKFGKILKG